MCGYIPKLKGFLPNLPYTYIMQLVSNQSIVFQVIKPAFTAQRC